MKKTSLTKIVLMWALFLMPTLLVHAQDEEVVATAKPTVFVDKISAGSSSDKLTVLNAVATALTQSGRVIVITSDSERASSFIDQHNSQDDVTAGSDMVAERLAVSMKLGVQYYLAFTVDDIAYSYNSGSASCKITLTGKVIDPKTSSVKGTKQMSFDGSNSDNSQSKAFASAVESITSAKTVLTATPLFQFIEENFPIVCQIVDIDKAMIQNLQNNDILLQGSQSEAVEKMLQNAGTDVKVLVRCNQSVGSTGIVTVTVEMTAVEAFTSTTLASTKLIGQNRGDSLLVLEQTINAKANQQQRNSFFQQLQNVFNAIAINGLEVELNLVIDQNVDDFSFEDELDNGAIFKDAFEAWLRQVAVNGNERISMSSEKYLGATLRVPYFDEKGQSYKTSGFHAALRKQMAELLGDDHLAKIDVMGQKVIVTIQ